MHKHMILITMRMLRIRHFSLTRYHHPPHITKLMP